MAEIVLAFLAGLAIGYISLSYLLGKAMAVGISTLFVKHGPELRELLKEILSE